MGRKIRVITTGGTIDGLEHDSEKDFPKNHKTLIPDLLKQARITLDYDIEEVIAKDSTFINDEDRTLILDKCKSSLEDRIIITHGTETMVETAKYLGEGGLDKTIILLGAVLPANKENSDALFNLGSAVMAVQFLSKGVYIVMNGKVFNWDNVKKDFDKGVFEKSK